MESHSYIDAATVPSGEYGGDPQDVVGRHLGREFGVEGPSRYSTIGHVMPEVRRSYIT